MRPPPWALLVPALGIVIVIAVPLVRYVQKTRAEGEAVEFLRRVQAAQTEFRAARTDGGYASALSSLFTPCSSGTTARVTLNDVTAMSAAGYVAQLRAAEGAAPLGVDCHGRATVSDYYAAAAPQWVEAPGQQAFAATASGRIYVFFDGIAPLERDMTVSGLATPLESLGTFKIP